ncbi:MAG: aromatic amino acid lyase [Treponema phagedenis]|uniref:HAL/PAL/TAL family ammonia-lyase n=1 Tax=Treponema phagedenis TaxID=162 RepID=UPI0011E7EE05|nr:aromatic amino acid lyase [Treponema phagedenis]QEJ95634.1 histidine ammonia-lyase [Treponema phagedenis]QSH95548.1 aromatic amino acid lyase [Treponema phagedenis]
MDTLLLTGTPLSLDDVYSVAYDRRSVEISEEAEKRVQTARQILFDMAAEGKPVYGLNRGVGWNKDKEFDSEFFATYNRNLLNSHCLGVKPYHTDEQVRAILLLRLNKALTGHTGISAELLYHYRDFLNYGIHPKIPMRSSIGEGDITTLSHIGLAFIGEEDVSFNGETMNSRVAMEKVGLKPAKLGPKDGLSIVSCNAQGEAMTAIVLKEIEDVIQISNLIFCLSLEGLNGVVQSLREDVNAVRGIKGQIKAAKMCREFLKGSFLYDFDPERALQDPLSFRCAHAVNGSMYDAMEYVKEQLLITMNTTDDNPCILIDEHTAFVSANFEITSLAIGVEMLATALSHISKTSCYRMIKLADPAFTKLNRFLTPEDVKTIAFGTIQKTFTMLDTQNRGLANPSSMDFYSLAGTIEDHASNLPLACYKIFQMIDNIYYVIGIEAMHAAQAIDLRKNYKLGAGTKKAYALIREVLPFYSEDRNLSKDIEKIYEFIKSKKLLHI